MKRIYLHIFLFCFFFCVPNSVFSQQTTQTTNKEFTVKLSVSVTDEKGRAVQGLTKENFSIFENKEQQEIESVEIKDEPTSIAVLYDGSGSMMGIDNLTKIVRLELLKFIQYNLQTSEFLIAGFSSSPLLLSDWSNENDVIVKGLEKFDSIADLVKQQKSTKMPRTTAIYDACLFTLEKIELASNERKIILLITDSGGDSSSKSKFKDLRKKLKASNAIVYVITLPLDPFFSLGISTQGDLEEIAQLTGGKAFFLYPQKAFDIVFLNSLKKDIPISFENIDALIKNQYVISYKPKNIATDGKWRKVELKITKPKWLKGQLKTDYRKGYFAPIK